MRTPHVHAHASRACFTRSPTHPAHALQDRSIIVKAQRILADFCTSKQEALGLPDAMVVRAREAADSFTADATAAGMLNKADSAKMKPPKLVVRGTSALLWQATRAQPLACKALVR